MSPLLVNLHDGGRADSGRRGAAGDCVARAIAIAGRLDYDDVYRELAHMMAATGKARSAREGIDPKVMRVWFADHDWTWTPTMQIGQGCTVHLREGEVPMTGRHVVRVSGHIVALVDGVLHDTHDPTRDGTRCVYGYWTAP
jgi:hypothetical protein